MHVELTRLARTTTRMRVIGLVMPSVMLYPYRCSWMRSTFVHTHIYQRFTFYMQLMLHVRIDPLDQIENPSKFIVDPWIDKPWGSTLREKLPRFVRLRYINWGAKERQQAFLASLPGISNSNPRAIYLVFWTNPNFYYCIYPCFLVCVLESRWKKARHQTWTSRSRQSTSTNFNNWQQDDRGTSTWNIDNVHIDMTATT